VPVLTRGCRPGLVVEGSAAASESCHDVWGQGFQLSWNTCVITNRSSEKRKLRDPSHKALWMSAAGSRCARADKTPQVRFGMHVCNKSGIDSYLENVEEGDGVILTAKEKYPR
jgi:hypothetical protein